MKKTHVFMIFTIFLLAIFVSGCFGGGSEDSTDTGCGVEDYYSEICGACGDCDEAAFLYASILESAGIRTGIVHIPNHAFLIIKLGDVWRGFETATVSYNKDTLFREFTESISEGNKKYLQWKDNSNATIVYPSDEWEKGLRKIS